MLGRDSGLGNLPAGFLSVLFGPFSVQMMERNLQAQRVFLGGGLLRRSQIIAISFQAPSRSSFAPTWGPPVQFLGVGIAPVCSPALEWCGKAYCPGPGKSCPRGPGIWTGPLGHLPSAVGTGWRLQLLDTQACPGERTGFQAHPWRHFSLRMRLVGWTGEDDTSETEAVALSGCRSFHPLLS